MRYKIFRKNDKDVPFHFYFCIQLALYLLDFLFSHDFEVVPDDHNLIEKSPWKDLPDEIQDMIIDHSVKPMVGDLIAIERMTIESEANVIKLITDDDKVTIQPFILSYQETPPVIISRDAILLGRVIKITQMPFWRTAKECARCNFWVSGTDRDIFLSTRFIQENTYISSGKYCLNMFFI